MWFFRSPQVVFGDEALSYLSSLPIRRAAIITDRYLLGTELPERVRGALPEGAESLVVGDVSAEPPLSEMTAHLEKVRGFSPDWFVAAGGGSSIDTAKILFALYERPDLTVYDITPLVQLGLRTKSRLIAVPTTSGTGSECTWAAVLSEENEKRKHELASPEILPDYAILDPSLVVSLPPEQTRNTAADAVAHAVEAYGSTWHNPFSDAMAEKALELISENIEGVIRDPWGLGPRGQVHIGASMAGLSFSNSQIGLVHALGHSLGATFKLPHGKAVGLLLPYVVDFNYDACPERYDRLNMLIPPKYRGRRLSGSLRSLLGMMGVARTVRDAGVEEPAYASSMDALVTLASESTGMVTNPKDSGSEDLRNIFIKAFDGD